MAKAKGLKRYAVSVLGGLCLAGLAATGFAASTTDLIVVIDESGSMDTERNFIGNYIENMDTVLEENGVSTNQYGLVGYGGHYAVATNEEGHKHTVGGGDLGTAAEFSAATDGLQVDGGTEDGYEAMMFALENYTFRSNAGASLFLITDEDRDDITNATVDYNSMLAAIQDAGVVMHAMVDQRFYDTDGNTAIAIDAQGNAYLLDEQGNITVVQGGASRTDGDGEINASGATDDDYTELALATGGIVADLDANRTAIEGNNDTIAQSFAELLTDIILETTQQQTPVSGLLALAETPAQKVVARVLQDENNLAAVRTAINAMLSNSKKRDTLEQLTPRKIFAMVQHAIRSGHNKQKAMKRRMRRIRTGQAEQFDVSGFAFNYKGREINGEMLKEMLPQGLLGGAAGDSDLVPRHGFFLSGSLSRGDYDRAVGSDPYEFDSWSIAAGTDYRLTEAWTAGASLSFETSDTDFADNISKTDMSTVGLSFYGMYTFQPNMYLEGTAGYNWTSYSAERYTGLPGFAAAESDPKGHLWQFSLELGRDFEYERWRFEPSVSGAYSRIEIDAYSETGAGAANLTVSDQDAHSFIGSIGGRIGYEYNNPNSFFIPEVHAYWEHEFANDSRNIESAFSNAPGAIFAVATEEPDRDYVRVGLGLTGHLGDRAIVTLSGDSLVGFENLEEYTLSGSVKWKF